MPSDKTITILAASGPVEVPLRLPRSFALRREIRAALAADSGISHTRALGAALGACWAHATVRLPAPDAFQFRLASYGGQIVDELCGRGYDCDSVLEAGMEAWLLIHESITTQRGDVAVEVEAAVDFSDPGRDPGTPSAG